ncbi:hypothetical protein DFH06DRAFT_1121537 [Mycena polygramma]|nr:hypothetical protein DFH06DRAFT_1121537 [Mycena polygramma]
MPQRLEGVAPRDESGVQRRLLSSGRLRQAGAEKCCRSCGSPRCYPALAGTEISIVRESLELGYASSVAGAPIISQALSTTTAEFIGEPSVFYNNGFVLLDAKQDDNATALVPTWANGAIELQTLVTPEDGAGVLSARRAMIHPRSLRVKP